ncbi:MAG: YraN family protein [Polyangiaceae bacterium]
MGPRELGRQAEVAVADCLFVQGFDILWRNLRVGALELDVVARRGPLAVVVEVRTRRRGAMVGPFESVGAVKRRRLLLATSRLWDRHLRQIRGVQRLRIDVAAVTFDRGQTCVTYAEGAISG